MIREVEVLAVEDIDPRATRTTAAATSSRASDVSRRAMAVTNGSYDNPCFALR
ncbi:MAG: hypothetical protein U0326_09320 [Polyangiales bacterium]